MPSRDAPLKAMENYVSATNTFPKAFDGLITDAYNMESPGTNPMLQDTDGLSGVEAEGANDEQNNVTYPKWFIKIFTDFCWNSGPNTTFEQEAPASNPGQSAVGEDKPGAGSSSDGVNEATGPGVVAVLRFDTDVTLVGQTAVGEDKPGAGSSSDGVNEDAGPGVGPGDQLSESDPNATVVVENRACSSEAAQPTSQTLAGVKLTEEPGMLSDSSSGTPYGEAINPSQSTLSRRVTRTPRNVTLSTPDQTELAQHENAGETVKAATRTNSARVIVERIIIKNHQGFLDQEGPTTEQAIREVLGTRSSFMPGAVFREVHSAFREVFEFSSGPSPTDTRLRTMDTLVKYDLLERQKLPPQLASALTVLRQIQENVSHHVETVAAPKVQAGEFRTQVMQSLSNRIMSHRVILAHAKKIPDSGSDSTTARTAREIQQQASTYQIPRFAAIKLADPRVAMLLSDPTFESLETSPIPMPVRQMPLGFKQLMKDLGVSKDLQESIEQARNTDSQSRSLSEALEAVKLELSRSPELSGPESLVEVSHIDLLHGVARLYELTQQYLIPEALQRHELNGAYKESIEPVAKLFSFELTSFMQWIRENKTKEFKVDDEKLDSELLLQAEKLGTQLLSLNKTAEALVEALKVHSEGIASEAIRLMSAIEAAFDKITSTLSKAELDYIDALSNLPKTKQTDWKKQNKNRALPMILTLTGIIIGNLIALTALVLATRRTQG